MFNFFPQILIILAVAALIIILVRNFSKASDIREKEKNKNLNSKGLWGRVIAVLKYLAWRLKIFSLSVFKVIYSRIKGTKESEKGSKGSRITSGLVKNESKIKDLAKVEKENEIKKDQNKILDLLEEAAEFLGNGSYSKAEKLYIEIIKLDPQNVRAYKGLGKIYRAQGNIEDAKSSFNQVLIIKPGDSEAKEELKKIQLG